MATVLLAGIELLAVGCGSSNRVIQSVTVTPATADAQNFPNGQVQFTASGNYSRPPSPVALSQANWWLSDGSMATLTGNGLAQCVPGASGVATVRAGVSGPCRGTNCTAVQIVGTAQLSCP
ncbi:MAG TPA: hypothetical protein VGS78_10920 [Candidatus Sulfotelmatobacter sp.]|nr:hypothetical protein [Candidatus Sulfotelmatobacter sp.]